MGVMDWFDTQPDNPTGFSWWAISYGLWAVWYYGRAFLETNQHLFG